MPTDDLVGNLGMKVLILEESKTTAPHSMVWVYDNGGCEGEDT